MHPLNTKELAQLEGAVTAAELTTRGDIVPILALRSATRGHISLILAMIALFALSPLWMACKQWPHLWPIASFIWIVLVAWMVLYGRKSSRLLRWLTSPNDLAHQVHAAAMLEFLETTAARTPEGTSIMIFASFAERRVVILADSGIAQILPPHVWQDLVKGLSAALKDRKVVRGFTECIEACAKLMAPHFPITDSRHKLTNELRLRDYFKDDPQG